MHTHSVARFLSAIIYTYLIHRCPYQSVLSDEQFNLPTPPALTDKSAAERVLAWCTENEGDIIVEPLRIT